MCRAKCPLSTHTACASGESTSPMFLFLCFSLTGSFLRAADMVDGHSHASHHRTPCRASPAGRVVPERVPSPTVHMQWHVFESRAVCADTRGNVFLIQCWRRTGASAQRGRGRYGVVNGEWWEPPP